MRLPRIVKRLLHRSGWEKTSYGDLLQCPIGKLVSLQIAMAVRDRATHVCWGIPPDADFTDTDVAEILARHTGTIRTCSGREDSAAKSAECPAPGAERIDSVTFRRRDGLPEIPTWQKVNGQWYRYPGVPTGLFAYVPQHLCQRLVALETMRDQALEAEWIEYTVTARDEHRTFVRVDLIFEVNNSVTMELLESRVDPRDTTVWRQHRRV